MSRGKQAQMILFGAQIKISSDILPELDDITDNQPCFLTPGINQVTLMLYS